MFVAAALHTHAAAAARAARAATTALITCRVTERRPSLWPTVNIVGYTDPRSCRSACRTAKFCMHICRATKSKPTEADPPLSPSSTQMLNQEWAGGRGK